MVENWNVWAGDTKVIMYPELYNVNWSLLKLPNWKVMRVQQQFIIQWKYTSQLEHQQGDRAQRAAWAGGPDHHVTHHSFTSILPPAHTSGCIRGERGSPIWSNERGGKCPNLVYRWIGSACASQKWYGSCITFPLQSGPERQLQRESLFHGYYVTYLVIFTLCERKNSLRWTIDGPLWVENGLSGLLET